MKDLADISEFIKIDSSSPSYLSWKKVPSRSKVVLGQPALASPREGGYYCGKFKSVNLYAHRVVYYLTHGEWPEVVDHLDGCKQNNAPSNLRRADTQVNAHNRRTAKGYSWRKNRGCWVARIKVGGLYKYLGSFSTEGEARAAYLNAKLKYHPSTPAQYFN